MPRSCWRRMRPIWRIRRSATCSSNRPPSPIIDAIICARRPRAHESRLYMGHVLAGRPRVGDAVEFETDREHFIGRGGEHARARRAHAASSRLSGATGAVLDPIVSLRARLRVPPGVTARVSFTTVVAENEDGVRALIEKYHDPQVCARAFALASTHSEIELRHLGVTREDGSRYQRLAGRVIYADPRLRSPEAVVAQHGHASGFVEVRHFRRPADRAGDGRRRGARRPRAGARPRAGVPARAWVQVRSRRAQRNSDELSPGRAGRPAADGRGEPVACVARSARRVVSAARRPDGRRRSCAAARRCARDPGRRARRPRRADAAAAAAVGAAAENQNEARSACAAAGLQRPHRTRWCSSNGFGGFTRDGKEFHVSERPPAPWSNVIANERFGFVATDSGLGATWSENSYHNRLTPWSNDPIVDPPSEVVYLRDDKSGEFWTATPSPAAGAVRHVAKFGQGYATYTHRHRRARRGAHDVCARERSDQDSAAPHPQRRDRGSRAERLLLRGLVSVGYTLALGGAHRDVD